MTNGPTSGRSGAEAAELVGVVDLGSTAVRLLVARVTPTTGYRVLAEERVPTRLGGGAPGTLPREAIDATLRTVHRFFARYSPNGRGPRIVAVATSAVRDAENRERLLDPLRRDRTRRHGLRLHQSDVTAIRERLEGLSRRKRRRIRGLKAERVDIILAGAIVIEELMVFGGYLTLAVCTRGIRDAILVRETFRGRE